MMDQVRHSFRNERDKLRVSTGAASRRPFFVVPGRLLIKESWLGASLSDTLNTGDLNVALGDSYTAASFRRG